MLTEQDAKCRFCNTESVEIVEKENKDPSTSFDKDQDKPLGAGKKGTTKTQKESFKIWG